MTWQKSIDSCPLCEMEKKTKWYEETEEFVVAEKLGGGPFIVLKNHVKEPDEETVEKAHNLVDSVFGDHDFRVLMNIVKDHWHAHIVTDEKPNRSLDDE